MGRISPLMRSAGRDAADEVNIAGVMRAGALENFFEFPMHVETLSLAP